MRLDATSRGFPQGSSPTHLVPPTGEPSWSELCCYNATEFGKCCSGADGAIKERIFFPVPPETVVNGQSELRSSYNSTLPLLGADICFLGWYLPMHDAMQASDAQWIQLQRERGRSVTLGFWDAGGMTPVASLSPQYPKKLAKHSELADTDPIVGDKDKACLDADGVPNYSWDRSLGGHSCHPWLSLTQLLIRASSSPTDPCPKQPQKCHQDPGQKPFQCLKKLSLKKQVLPGSLRSMLGCLAVRLQARVGACVLSCQFFSQRA